MYARSVGGAEVTAVAGENIQGRSDGRKRNDERRSRSTSCASDRSNQTYHVSKVITRKNRGDQVENNALLPHSRKRDNA